MFIASLLFGISASLDALLVGLTYGIRGVRIRSWQNLVISLITLFSTCLSVGLGQGLTTLLPELIAHRGGSLILICLGLYYLLKWCTASLKSRRLKALSPPTAALDSQDHITGRISDPAPDLMLPEIFALSLTLSLNNMGLGLSASLGGLSLTSAAVSTLVCSVLFLSAGNRLGGSPLLQLAGQATDPLSGLLLIGLGLLQLCL